VEFRRTWEGNYRRLDALLEEMQAVQGKKRRNPDR
jgi:uncharacterized protein YqiB (DUF1249 family)